MPNPKNSADLSAIIVGSDRLAAENIELEDQGKISGLNRVNIFVGQNNAGKSRVLRELSKASTDSLRFRDGRTANFAGRMNDVLAKATESLRPVFKNPPILKIQEAKEVDSEEYSAEELFSFTDVWNEITSESAIRNAKKRGLSPDSFRTYLEKAHPSVEEGSNILAEAQSAVFRHKLPRFYIPVLRGLRTFSESKDDVFASRTTRDYFHDEKSRPVVFTGLELYERLASMLLGEREARDKVREYEDFLRKSLYRNQTVTIIPKVESDVVHVRIGGDERPIYELGDGVQSMILLTVLPFVEEAALFFIEEPENYLHPGMQRKLLELLLESDYAKRHHFFLTTHSNHLLDMAVDFSGISVFRVSRRIAEDEQERDEPPSVVRGVPFVDRETLQDLGVRCSSVALVNATIWVEGITDRWFLRRLLELYQESLPDDKARYSEDTHFSFVEYGGSNITHWSFLDEEEHPIEIEKLCAEALLVTDRDADEKLLPRKKQLQRVLGDRYVCLGVREVENCLPPSVIWSVVVDYEKCGAAELPEGLPKEPPFVAKDYEDAYLGTFIDKQLDKLSGYGRRRKAPYAERESTENGSTIRSKRNFWDKALRYLQEYDSLEPRQIKLASQLYKFVAERN